MLRSRCYKILVLTAVVFILSGGSIPVLAAPMPPMPECMIKAKVVTADTQYSPSTDWAEKQGVADGKTGGWTVIRIIRTEKEPVEEPQFAEAGYCRENYSKEREITLRLEEDYRKETSIKGVISVSGDEYGTWYHMDEVKTLKSADEQSGIGDRFVNVAVTGIIVVAVLLSL